MVERRGAVEIQLGPLGKREVGAAEVVVVVVQQGDGRSGERPFEGIDESCLAARRAPGDAHEDRVGVSHVGLASSGGPTSRVAQICPLDGAHIVGHLCSEQ